MATCSKLTDTEKSAVSSSSGQEEPKTANQLEEKELERLAVEAILQETKLSKSRAERSGVLGWQCCPVPKANKRFLNNLVLSDVTSNKRRKTTLHRDPHKAKATILPRSKRDHSPKRDPPRSKRDHFPKRDPPEARDMTRPLNTH